MKYVVILFFLCYQGLAAQDPVDDWMTSQLDKVTWQGTYKGVLADYHPVTIVLASDLKQIAGYMIHQGDGVRHKLQGDWSKSNHFQLQERDDFDRLTGYLTGSISNDQIQMEWKSPDQSRLFNVIAFTETLIRIKNFKPVAESIEIPGTPSIKIFVQKMDFGLISGIVYYGNQYSRFDGNCLDGTCSMWSTVIRNGEGKPITVQMRQKDTKNYKATINGTDYTAAIISVTPLTVRQFDNSKGFLDLVYPQFESAAFNQWLGLWVDPLWSDGTGYLNSINQSENAGRLVYRSSGWIEVLDESESYVSGMITYINPGASRRETFVWLKKEDQFISQKELINEPADQETASSLALASTTSLNDQEYQTWLNKAGYPFIIPSNAGLIMSTEFNMMYGDDMKIISPDEGKNLVKRKYWKYFEW